MAVSYGISAIRSPSSSLLTRCTNCPTLFPILIVSFTLTRDSRRRFRPHHLPVTLNTGAAQAEISEAASYLHKNVQTSETELTP